MSTYPGFVHRPACELCGSPRVKILYSRPFTAAPVWDFIDSYYGGRVEKSRLEGAPYEVARCTACGFIWQPYILDDDGMSELYNQWISGTDSLRKKADLDFAATYAHQISLIAHFFPRRPKDSLQLLDFGMGWGFWCRAAAHHGYHVTGLEIAEDRVSFAREHGVEVIHSLDELGPKKLDFINAEQVFEHIPQPLATLKVLVGQLNPGGVIRIAVPDGRRIARDFRNPNWRPSKNAIHPLEHINCFTHKTLASLGHRAGLRGQTRPIPWDSIRQPRQFAKSVAARYYRQFFGTSMYFRKGD